jgi:hypothetical protein
MVRAIPTKASASAIPPTSGRKTTATIPAISSARAQRGSSRTMICISAKTSQPIPKASLATRQPHPFFAYQSGLVTNLNDGMS